MIFLAKSGYNGRHDMARRFGCRGSAMDLKQFDRITFDPQIMGGRACIRGMRIPVSLIVREVAAGVSLAEILSEHPELEAEDVGQALDYVAWLAEEEVRDV